MQPSGKRPTPSDLRRLVGSVNQLRFNDNKGEVTFFGQKMIILRRDIFRVMREGLERLVGEQAAPFLSFLASGVGLHEGSIFRDSLESSGGKERSGLEDLIHGALEDTNLGLGKIKVNKLNFEEGSAMVSVANCFESLENGPSDNPNCMFTSGFLAGLFAEVFDKTVQADETRCISQGNPECEFLISRAEEAAEANGTETIPPAIPASDIKEASPSKGVATGQATKNVEKSSDSKLAKTKPDVKKVEQSMTGQSAEPSPEDLDAGVETASRIAKRKRHFWQKLFKN